MGLSPHHRWPFNTSLATANEPGAAAAPLNPADSAQMFMSRSPAVPGWEGRLDPRLPGLSGVQGVGWVVEFHLLRFVTPGFAQQTVFDVALKEMASLFFGPSPLLRPSARSHDEAPTLLRKLLRDRNFAIVGMCSVRAARLRAPRGALGAPPVIKQMRPV